MNTRFPGASTAPMPINKAAAGNAVNPECRWSRMPHGLRGNGAVHGGG